MDEDSTSSETPASAARHFKCIIAIGVMGETDDVTRFAALWIADSERRAHQINTKLFKGRLQLLPLPEENRAEDDS